MRGWMQAERYDERLQNVFNDFICSEAEGGERIDGDDLWSCLSFIIIMEVYRQVGPYKEENG